MKRQVKFCLVALLIISLLCMNTYVFAVEDQGQSNNLTEDETQEIKNVITALFDAKCADLMNPTLADADYSRFWTQNSELSKEFFERCVMAIHKITADANLEMKNGISNLTFKNIQKQGKTVEVVVYEWLSCCYFDKNINEPVAANSGSGANYTIKLTKIDNNWLIEELDSDIREYQALKNTNLSVEEFTQAAEMAGVSDQEQSVEYFGLNADAMRSRAFDVNRFVEYAKKYAGSRRNSLFLDYTDLGGDCQNYASQCLWYAFGALGDEQSVNAHEFPMITAPGREWYNDGPGHHSASWTGVQSFANYVTGNSGNSQPGLYGYIKSGVAYAQPGDIIQISNGSEYYHSYVVTAVRQATPPYSPQYIVVCSHTSDHENVPLSLCVGSNTNNLRTIHVSGIN